MTHALIENGIVVNVIVIDTAMFVAEEERHARELAAYNAAVEVESLRHAAATEKYEKKKSEMEADHLEELGELELHSNAYKRKQRNFRLPPKPEPTSLVRPTLRKSAYVPPEGTLLVKIEGSCDIGWKYEGGKFINPNPPKNEAKHD